MCGSGAWAPVEGLALCLSDSDPAVGLPGAASDCGATGPNHLARSVSCLEAWDLFSNGSQGTCLDFQAGVAAAGLTAEITAACCQAP